MKAFPKSVYAINSPIANVSIGAIKTNRDSFKTIIRNKYPKTTKKHIYIKGSLYNPNAVPAKKPPNKAIKNVALNINSKNVFICLNNGFVLNKDMNEKRSEKRTHVYTK